jgi:small subunit ribosomal protein S16
MAARIRLKRVGAKKKPVFHLVVSDARSGRDTGIVDTLGSYNPKINPPLIQIDAEKLTKWMGFGAQLTDGATRVVRASKLVEDAKLPRLKPVRKSKEEIQAEATAKAAELAAAKTAAGAAEQAKKS